VKKSLLCMTLMLPFILSSVTYAGDVMIEGNQPYDKLPASITTPHIKWAKPLPGGAVKALVIAPTFSQRETVELGQRISLDYQVIMTATFDKFDYSAAAYMTVAPAIVAKIAEERLQKDYDVIIIGGVDWAALPSRVRLEILKKVYQGAGLLYVRPPSGNGELQKIFSGSRLEFDAGFVPMEKLPAFKGVQAGDVLKLYRFGKGAVGTLNYPGVRRSPYHCLTPDWDGGYENGSVFYDYYHSLLARLVLFLANRQSSIQISELSISGSVVKAVVNNGTTSARQVRMYLADRDSDKLLTGKESAVLLKPGRNELTFNLTPGKSGTHFADLFVYGEDGSTADWRSIAFDVERENKIADISLDKSFYTEGDKVQGTVTLQHAAASGKLTVNLLDNYGRLLATVTKNISGVDKASFALDVPKTLATMHAIEATLSSGTGVISQSSLEFPVRRATVWDPRDFRFIMWVGDIPRDHVMSDLFIKNLYNSGIDTIYQYYTPRYWNASKVEASQQEWNRELRSICGANLDVIPYFYRIYAKPNKHVREPCLTDPAYISRMENLLDKQTQVFAPYAPIAYSLGDENVLADGGTEICWSPTCLAGFRGYLKDRYGSLTNLNQIWQTGYTAWDDVVPSTLSEVKKDKNYPRWIDHRTYMEKVFADFLGRAADQIRQNDPQAIVGAEGWHPTNWQTGYDWQRLAGDFKLCNVYTTLHQQRLLSSFMRDKSLTGMWFGSYVAGMDEGHMRSHPWSSLFQGMNSAWWWTAFSSSGGAGGASAFSPDFSPLPALQQTLEEIGDIKSGIGKLLLSSKKSPARIAIQYSSVNLYASIVNPRDVPIPSLTHSWDSFALAFDTLGLDYSFLASKSIEQGGLKDYKVLVLPFAQSLSQREVAQIRAFVQSGGLVIADYFPGIMDQNCRMLPESSLADVFGKFSACSINNFGRGKSLYLGGYDKKAISGFLLSAGIEPRVKVAEKESGKASEGMTTAVFANGGVTYIGVLPDYKTAKKQSAEITFPVTGHIYDVRSKKYCGFASKITDLLTPGSAKVYAVSPYKVAGVQVSSFDSKIKRGRELKFQIRIKADTGRLAPHVVRIELINPKGMIVPEYAQNILVEGGICSAGSKVPFAYNELTGIWHIRVKDVMSGASGEAEFAVE
jgi:hypothetical protein